MNILIFLLTFIIMEGVTWCTHKFVMHGFLWNLHYDHHNKNKSKFMEKNDWFFVFFAIISMSLYFIGSTYAHLDFCISISLGILAYGIAYVIVHEIVIHKRILANWSQSFFYFRALQKAHKRHHSHLGPEDGECFGMLWVPFHYFREAFKNRKSN